jgi:DNA-binding transcriptional LysR family regulator
MDLDDLQTFARIADAGTISAAARASGAPKSSLSRSLTRFEASLGAVLFERGSRSLRLTEAGRVLLPHARRILDDVADAGAALDGLHGEPRGTLRINAAMTFALAMVAPMIPAFLERYPDVRVVLDTENRIVDLAREEVDVAIRIGALPDSDLIARKLGDIALWPCASPAYLARNGVPQTPADLAGHTLLGWSDQPSEWQFVDRAGAIHRVAVPIGTLVPEPAVLQVLLEGGVGIGRLPDFLARASVAAGSLQRLLSDFKPETVQAHAVYAAHRTLSAKVRLFIDALCEG